MKILTTMDNQPQQEQQKEQHQTYESRQEEMLAAEARAISSFLRVVNTIRDNGKVNPMSEKTALKFLISRKYDVQRALQLYQMHEITRLREGLTSIDPNDEHLKQELNTEKFTILKHRDSNDSAIAIFTAKLHPAIKSSKYQNFRKQINRYTLQGIVYQLDSALEDILTQRNGIVFVYNMSGSDYSNFDYELCQKILLLLKGAYPAKLKKVLIVSPPFWFRAPFHLLRLIVREKLRDRVWLLNIDKLLEHLPPQALTPELGGSYLHNHQAWIEECNNLHKTRLHDLCDPTSAQALVKSLSNKSWNSRTKRNSNDASASLEGLVLESYMQNLDETRLNSGTKRSKPFIYDYDDEGMSLSQLIEVIRNKGKKGLGEEYDEIAKKEDFGTFLVSSSPSNMRKNRYINVRCFDHTRVVLDPYDLPDGLSASQNDPMDYINASYIDGYRQPKAYVSTQGPIEQTFVDFWRMIWQTGCRVIVMVTLNIEQDRLKCDQYWPSSNNPIMMAGSYAIECLNQEFHDDFIVTHLRLTSTKSQVSRDIWHLQFISWPDFGTPDTSTALLKYRDSIIKKQHEAIEQTASTSYPPLVVHCSAGVGRSGTFVAIDIYIQKFETTGLVDIKSVVTKLREQRYYSIQTRHQYIFCYMALVEYAASCGLLAKQDIVGLFEDE